MMRTRVLKLGSAAAVVASAGLLAAHLVLPVASASTTDLVSEASVAQPIFSSVMPGARVSAEIASTLPDGQLMPGMTLPAGDMLVVTVPQSEVTATHQDGAAGDIATQDAVWRLSMAGAFAAAQLPNVSVFRLDGVPVAEPLGREFGIGILRTQPGTTPWGFMTKLDTVDAEHLRAQAASNAATIAKAFGDQFVSDRVDVVPVSPDRSAVGLRIALSVKSLKGVAEHLGDALVGGQIGLVGDPKALAEGVAITVCDATRCAGSFSATRRQTGDMLIPNEFDAPGMTVTTRFENLTGGPEVTAMAHGGAVSDSKKYSEATLEGAHKKTTIRGVPCPAGTGCTSGPDASEFPTLKCPTGRKFVLRLQTAAEHVIVYWSHATPSANSILAKGNAHRSANGRAWSLTVPRKARKATQLQLATAFGPVSTNFNAKTRCS
jgi:hypothetical protein